MRSLWICGLFLLVGCTKGEPTIESVEGIPSISLTTRVFASKNFDNLKVVLKGTCPPMVTDFELSANGSDFVSLAGAGLAAGSIVNECKSKGTFSISANNSSGLLSYLGLPTDQTHTLHLRGKSDFGVTPGVTFSMNKLSAQYTVRSRLSGSLSTAPGPVGDRFQSHAFKSVPGSVTVNGQTYDNVTTRLAY